jgi:hypothetical protein
MSRWSSLLHRPDFERNATATTADRVVLKHAKKSESVSAEPADDDERRAWRSVCAPLTFLASVVLTRFAPRRRISARSAYRSPSRDSRMA